MLDRLQEYLQTVGGSHTVTPITADASTRDYFRINQGEESQVACVYPSPFVDAETHPYVDVSHLFTEGGVRVPRIIDVAPTLGVIILEDVGDTLLRERLLRSEPELASTLMKQAIGIIADIQATTERAFERHSIASQLKFDFEKLNWELEFFTEHYFSSYRKSSARPPEGFIGELQSIATQLAAKAVTVTHRDFHAANVMIDSKGDLVVIDHQDARLGSIAYDLVSLLLDRIESPPSESILEGGIDAFLSKRIERNLPAISHEDFLEEFRLQSIQRCLKAIGTFSYQTAVRGRDGYEKYIMPMFEVVLRSASALGGLPHIESTIETELESHTR